MSVSTITSKQLLKKPQDKSIKDPSVVEQNTVVLPAPKLPQPFTPRKLSLDSKSTRIDSDSVNQGKDDVISNETLEEIREVFQFFDKEGRGYISTKELGTVMKALGQNPTEAELLDIITQADKDSNGLIDFEEFVDVMKDLMKDCDNEDDIKGAFRVFDKDGKGFITVDDLRDTISSLGEKFKDEEYEDMIRAADLDGDGQLTLTDFIELMMPGKSS